MVIVPQLYANRLRHGESVRPYELVVPAPFTVLYIKAGPVTVGVVGGSNESSLSNDSVRVKLLSHASFSILAVPTGKLFYLIPSLIGNICSG